MTRESDYSEFLDYMRTETLVRNPAMSNWNPHSTLRTLYEVESLVLAFVMQQVRNAKDANYVPTASGADLDRLVRDRIPAGRYLGTLATGSVTFIRDVDGPLITIPVGTRLAAIASGRSVLFDTAESVSLPPGTLRATADVVAAETGTRGNLAIGLLNGALSGIPGIDQIYNYSAMTGGTDVETDAELKDRYMFTYELVGAATPDTIERALEAIDHVDEGHVSLAGPGTVHVVVSGASDDDPEVGLALLEKLGAGTVSPGLRVGVIDGENITVDIDTCAGGHLYLYVKERIVVGGIVEMTAQEYTHEDNVYPVSFVIPDNTPRNTIIQATVDDEEASFLTVNETGFVGIAGLSADLYVGWGTFPRAWRKPFDVGVVVTVALTLEDFVSTDLLPKIARSIADWLNAFRIEEDAAWSRAFHCLMQPFVARDVAYGPAFEGVLSIDGLEMETMGGKYASDTTSKIDADNDERLYCTSVTINGDVYYEYGD